MKQQRAFVSYSAQVGDDGAWLRELLRGLRLHGYDLTEFEIVEVRGRWPDITAGDTGDALKVADLFVHLLDDAPQNQVNFSAGYGAAWVLGRDFVAIVPPGFDPSGIDIPKIEEHLVPQRSPTETVDLVLAKVRQPQVA